MIAKHASWNSAAGMGLPAQAASGSLHPSVENSYLFPAVRGIFHALFPLGRYTCAVMEPEADRALKPYRVYLLNPLAGEQSVIIFESRSDSEAYAIAKERAGARSYELWNGERLVIQKIATDAPAKKVT
ncbi:MAG: hypothetical protein ACREF6_14775 [Alphaproteobacteria bacterium]